MALRKELICRIEPHLFATLDCVILARAMGKVPNETAAINCATGTRRVISRFYTTSISSMLRRPLSPFHLLHLDMCNTHGNGTQMPEITHDAYAVSA